MGLHLLKSPNAADEKSILIHQRAITRARNFIAAEADVIESLREVEDDKTYRLFELTSVYAYATKQMKLSENIACDLIAIMRKSRKVPELAQAIRSGKLTSSKARKILPVINETNKSAWLELAMTQTSRAIEKAVVTERPQLATQESLRYKTSERLELTLGVSEEWAALLTHVKDLCSQKEGAAVSTEDALMAAMIAFVEKHDPAEKAKRSAKRNGRLRDVSVETRNGSESHAELIEVMTVEGVAIEEGLKFVEQKAELSVPGRIKGQRRKIPSHVLHRVHLRDGRQCTHRNSSGIRCDTKRWVDIHHVIEVARGGKDEVENLVTLCREHHAQIHSGMLFYDAEII